MCALKLALGRKTDAAQLLRRPAVAPPETTVFAVIGMVVFAWFRSPSADAILAAAHFDDAVFLRMERDAPIETIAAEIKQLTAGIPVLGQCVERIGRMVFRMAARQTVL